MSAEGNPTSISELFETQQRMWKPYEGETKAPVTLLDRVVIDVIDHYGYDNDVAVLDPYKGSSRPELEPKVEVVGNGGGRMRFGQDFMTRHLPYREGGNSSIIYVYEKERGGGRVIIDDFEGSSFGGLASRTCFSSLESEPDKINKHRQTDFSSFIGNIAVNPRDFSRGLKRKEQEVLLGVLATPEILVVSADELSSGNQRRRAAFYVVTGENSREAKMRQQSAKDAEKRIKEYNKFIDDLDRATMRSPSIWAA